MSKVDLLRPALIAIAIAIPTATYAQATRTWVSGVGDDANPCSRTAPCKTWAGAIVKTAAGGEIDNLDTGGYGALTITKSITIDGGGGAVASSLTSGTAGMVISAGSNDVVILRNLDFQGLLGNATSPGTAGTNGIQIIEAGAVVIENCHIYGFANWGILVAPNSNSNVTIRNTGLFNNGIGQTGSDTGGALLVNPTNSATVSTNIVGSTAAYNAVGFKAIADNTTGTVLTVINGSQSYGNQHSGFAAESGAGPSNGPVSMLVDGGVSADNNVGVNGQGSNVTIRVGNTTITGNNTGVVVSGSASVLSYKTNEVNGNSTDGTPITAVPNGLN